MAKAKEAASSLGGAKQATLPAVARQQMHAVRSVADQVEKASPGAIHAVNFTFSGKRLQASIVYNRNRGEGAEQQASVKAHEAATQAQRRPTTSSAARKPRADKAGAQCSDKSRAGAGDERADKAMGYADEASSVAAAAKMRRYITEVTTEVVRALGGDSVTGGQYLCPDKTPLTLFGQQLRAVRIPKGSPAADMRHEELWGNVEHLHSKLDADGNLFAQSVDAESRQGAGAGASIGRNRGRDAPPWLGLPLLVGPTWGYCGFAQPAILRHTAAGAWRLSVWRGPDSPLSTDERVPPAERELSRAIGDRRGGCVARRARTICALSL